MTSAYASSKPRMLRIVVLCVEPELAGLIWSFVIGISLDIGDRFLVIWLSPPVFSACRAEASGEVSYLRGKFPPHPREIFHKPLPTPQKSGIMHMTKDRLYGAGPDVVFRLGCLIKSSDGEATFGLFGVQYFAIGCRGSEARSLPHSRVGIRGLVA